MGQPEVRGHGAVRGSGCRIPGIVTWMREFLQDFFLN